MRFNPFSGRSLTILPPGLAMLIPMRILVRVAYFILFLCAQEDPLHIRYPRGDVEGHGAHRVRIVPRS